MPSQSDLDQGGTDREWLRVYRGPSVGWISIPYRNVLLVTAAGIYTLNLSTSLVQVSVAGAVTIVLPSAIDPSVGPQALPGAFAKNPVTIVDIGGYAGASPITIEPASGSENILGLASIQINSNYGGYTLLPSSKQKGWTNPQ
jgi:hypothetical protein